MASGADDGIREFRFLGTGTSCGVPTIGCRCKVCTSGDPRNQRTRSSAIVTTPAGRLLIDAGPDLRQQFLREGLSHADAVLLTHHHADHILGLDDVRIFSRHLGGRPVPVYCDPEVEEVLRRVFFYALDPSIRHTSAASVPQLDLRRIERPTARILDLDVSPIPLRHGPYNVLGFRFGPLAYCTDTNGVPEESWPLLEGVDTLVLDALRMQPHPTHFTLDEALETIERIAPRRAYLTHLSCRMDPDAAARRLPENVQFAYDGLRLHF